MSFIKPRLSTPHAELLSDPDLKAVVGGMVGLSWFGVPLRLEGFVQRDQCMCWLTCLGRLLGEQVRVVFSPVTCYMHHFW